jgi:hypothetical protein
MIPTFSTEQYASSRFTSSCAKANAMPSSELVAPSAMTTHPAALGIGSHPLKRTIP